jgi:type II secretory pathway component GspD/PulD (secretin)
VFLLASIGGVGAEQEAPRVADIPGGNLSISVRHTDIAEIFEMLSRHSKANILLSNDVEGEVSVNLYDLTLEEAVEAVAAAGGFVAERDGDAWHIVAREDAGQDFADGFTEVRSFKVQYTDSEAVAAILENYLSRYGEITALPERKLLVIEETPQFMRRVEALLGEIDREPVQILIEARILEVTLDATDIYGIDWSQTFESGDSSGSLGVQRIGATTVPGFFFSVFNDKLDLALNALSAKGRVQTLSTPKLLALEHEEAEVVIGDRIGYRVTTTINQVTTESIEFLETGVILRVRSYVDRAGRIMMDIHPEVSTGTISLDGVPNKTSTEVTTQLLADDGQTIFIGGLIRNTRSKRREGVPVLGDLPLVGPIFSNNEELQLRTETVVLITPRIMQAQQLAMHREQAERLSQIEADYESESAEIDERLDRKWFEFLEQKQE